MYKSQKEAYINKKKNQQNFNENCLKHFQVTVQFLKIPLLMNKVQKP